MSSALITVSITGVLLAALVGYLTQQHLITGSAPPPRIVGIDLGTTYSAVAVYHTGTGRTQVIAVDDDGGTERLTMPDNMTVYVGYAAQRRLHEHHNRTIYDAKRFIGRQFDRDSDEWRRIQERYPFTIELNDDGRAYFVITQTRGEHSDQVLDKPVTHHISPEQIGAYIIAHLRSRVHASTGQVISACVLSAPAEFDARRRNATGDAARAAGMQVTAMISEPTAAALAYGLHKRDNVQTVVVVDLGGGTLDVSVLWLQGGMFVTRALAGNNRLGGQDINELLLHHFLKVMSLEWSAEDVNRVRDNPRDMQALRAAVEHAKLQLSTKHKTVTHVHLESHPQQQFQYTLSRDELNTVCAPLMQRILQPVRAAIVDADVTIDDVDEIVLVGGSTLVPRVRQIIGEYFKRAPSHGVDAELAVVIGAAVQAGVVSGGWPLTVAAVELPSKAKKVHVYDGLDDKW